MTILAIFIFANISGCSNLSRFDSYDMKDIMLAQFDKPRKSVTDEDFLQLKKLNSTSNIKGRTRVVNFPYINKAANLEEIYLLGYSIDDLSPLNGMQKLKNLSFFNCEVNISQVRQTTNLNSLSIFDSNVTDSDIVHLAHFTELKILMLSSNEITNIEPLSQMVKLKILFLRDNRISDISVLLNMQSLKYLDIANNPLNDNSINVVIPKLKANGVKVAYGKS
jgi:internalin A